MKKEAARELLEKFVRKQRVNRGFADTLTLNDSQDIDSFLSTLPEEKEDTIVEKIEKVKNMRPYKKPGDRESYYEYAEGWCDACDALKDEFNPSK